ncbi:unnamed protein product [Polarella glacialis]|uniref:Uncharacterized protein n=1 Tax=Polarella glacialis TaxID=89957 RepID=A0A813HWK1_POLGL|nr:unnamed protein product [Polarella glacialis]
MPIWQNIPAWVSGSHLHRIRPSSHLLGVRGIYISWEAEPVAVLREAPVCKDTQVAGAAVSKSISSSRRPPPRAPSRSQVLVSAIKPASTTTPDPPRNRTAEVPQGHDQLRAELRDTP